MEPQPMSGVVGDPGAIELEKISRDVQVLSEETLKQLRKGPLVKFAAGCHDAE